MISIFLKCMSRFKKAQQPDDIALYQHYATRNDAPVDCGSNLSNCMIEVTLIMFVA
jgi:hypothetical protein